VYWKSVFYPENMPEGPYFKGMEALYTDLECSRCGHHVYPPTYPDRCPRCGEKEEFRHGGEDSQR